MYSLLVFDTVVFFEYVEHHRYANIQDGAETVKYYA
jgi:hypothetical protein